MISEQFVVAYLMDGGVFEADDYQQLIDKIVNFYSENDAPSFLGIEKLEYADDDICIFQDNSKLETLIEKAKQEGWENDKSDLANDYLINLI